MSYWKIYEMALWKGKSCDKLNYDMGSILKGWHVAVCLWRHKKRSDGAAFSAVKFVIKLDETVFSLRFWEFNMQYKEFEINFHFIRYLSNPLCVLYPIAKGSVFMKLDVCFISPRQRRGYIKTDNSFHKYRMKWKFISDPIYTSNYNYDHHKGFSVDL